MIKAVFFDLDGTLISDTTGEIPESARNAVEQLRKKESKFLPPLAGIVQRSEIFL